MTTGSDVPWYRSIRTRLAIATLLASMGSMLVIAELTSDLVTERFDRNVETWLYDTSSYFQTSLSEAQTEAEAIAQHLATDPALTAQDGTKPLRLPADVTRLAATLGYDIVVLYDEAGAAVYATTAAADVPKLPKDPRNALLRIQPDDRTRLILTGAAQTMVAGRHYTVLVGTRLDESFLRTARAVTSLEIGLYYRQPDRFLKMFSSQRPIVGDEELPDGVMEQLKTGETAFLDRHPEGEEYRVLYRALRRADGSLIGVIFCGLRAQEAVSGWISHSDLFLGIFVTGSLLSGVAVLFVSRRLARPLRSLARGVRLVSAGDFQHRVPDDGHDEVAELAKAFNGMSVKLGQMHELEQQLRRRDRLSALGEVAVGIAHEVRNPLGTIKTSAELVRRSPTLAASDAKLLGYVVDEVRRIDGLINDFLSFARPPEPVLLAMRPAAVIDRVSQFCEPELSRHHVTLVVHDDSGAARIEADSDHVYQACLNLVLNAIDAMPGGGTLTIDVAQVAQTVRLTFRDTGPGIPAHQQERIFNPFFTTKSGGTGLGLAKVFAIMQSHRGQVECVSAPGQGAAFALIFPLIPAPPASQETAHAAHDPAGR